VTAQAEEAGDFVRVASCSTPTEAHLLKGVLESAGLSPRVADANFVQAYSWMAPAAGGVRVLVPASQVAAARQAITDFNDGAYQLGDEEVAAPSYSELPKPLFRLQTHRSWATPAVAWVSGCGCSSWLPPAWQELPLCIDSARVRSSHSEQALSCRLSRSSGISLGDRRKAESSSPHMARNTRKGASPSCRSLPPLLS